MELDRMEKEKRDREMAELRDRENRSVNHKNNKINVKEREDCKFCFITWGMNYEL
jgi:hypothetical protein